MNHRFTLFAPTLFAVALGSTRMAFAQSLDSEVPVAHPRPAPVLEPETPPQSSVSSSARPQATAMTAAEYQRRSTTLFATLSMGYGAQPGINPYFNPGVTLAGTVRSIWGGFLLDVGFDVAFSVLCLGSSCAFLQLQPSVRAGYSGEVSSRVALGVRGGYAPAMLIGSNSGVGSTHQLDLDVHVTVITARGALIEPFLGGGVNLTGDRFNTRAVVPTPVALLGLRIGATL
jgi:hypothetical protein